MSQPNRGPAAGNGIKAVILAGGLGTRIAEETHLHPKPMVEIGGKPILRDILKLYSRRCHHRSGRQPDGAAPTGGGTLAGDAGGHRREHRHRRPVEAAGGASAWHLPAHRRRRRRINSGFFVLELALIAGDATTRESEPLQELAERGAVQACGHRGFWRPMDSLRDRTQLEELWASGRAAWKLW